MAIFHLILHTDAPTVLQSPTGTTVTQPNDAQFTCGVRGVPIPTIIWNRNNNNVYYPKYAINTGITPASSTIYSGLTIRNTNPSDAGAYYCIISNSEGTFNLSASLTVNVRPTVSSMMSAYSVFVNDQVTFQCIGTGFPEPTINWYKNGSLINDTRFFESQNGTFDDSSMIYNVTGSLILTDAKNTDSDYHYECAASNSVGDATAAFSLATNGKCMTRITN